MTAPLTTSRPMINWMAALNSPGGLVAATDELTITPHMVDEFRGDFGIYLATLAHAGFGERALGPLTRAERQLAQLSREANGDLGSQFSRLLQRLDDDLRGIRSNNLSLFASSPQVVREVRRALAARSQGFRPRYQVPMVLDHIEAVLQAVESQKVGVLEILAKMEEDAKRDGREQLLARKMEMIQLQRALIGLREQINTGGSVEPLKDRARSILTSPEFQSLPESVREPLVAELRSIADIN